MTPEYIAEVFKQNSQQGTRLLSQIEEHGSEDEKHAALLFLTGNYRHERPTETYAERNSGPYGDF